MAVSKRLSRRGFLAMGALGATGALLAACAGQPAAPTAAPAATAKPAEAKPTEKPAAAATTAPAAAATKPAEAAKPTAAAAAKPAAGKAADSNLIAASWVIEEWKLKDWIDEYNKLGQGKVNLEQMPDTGFNAKLQAMVRSGDVLYDGVGIMTPFIDKVQWVESEMVQPIDAFVQSSAVDGAKELIADLVPTIKQDITYKGKVYGIPYSVEAIGLMWYTEQMKGIGLPDGPATWDETLDAARKIGTQYKSQQITPFGWNMGIHTCIQGLMHTATKTPYTADGLLDITGEAAMKSLNFMQSAFKEGLTPPHGGDGVYELWQRAKVAIFMAQNSRGVWAQRVFGMDKAATGKLPLPAKGAANSGSPFWSNTFTVANKAKQPQAMTDFYIWLLGPKNAKVHKAIIESGKAPVLNSIYESQIKGNKDYAWMALHRDMIADSIPYPENTFWNIENQKIMPWLVKLLEKDSKLTPEEAMKNALQETKDEIAKQKVK